MAHINDAKDRARNNIFGRCQWRLWSQHLVVVILIGAQGSNPKLTRNRQLHISTMGHLGDKAS
jgi:hypothetical protein